LTKLANGDQFEGQMNIDGKRDGFGYAVIDGSSAIYEGYWSNGAMHGSGRLTNKNGFYVGEFSSN
jgi:hypothetical protein